METHANPPLGIAAPEPLLEFANLVYFYRNVPQSSERPAEWPSTPQGRPPLRGVPGAKVTAPTSDTVGTLTP